MNTEIFDYLKELSKKEFFIVNVLNTIFSLIIIAMAVIVLKSGANRVTNTVMFVSAAFLLATNAYKCFKRKSKNGWVFAVMSVVFLAAAVVCLWIM